MYPADTSTERCQQSDAHHQNHQSAATESVSANPVRGHAMDDMDKLLSMIDDMNAQIKSIMELLRIDHIEDNNPDAG
jgi:uncharacterized FlaG/YvyC family protein